MPWTFFYTKYGMPSQPGAEEGEDLLRACLISSLVKGSAAGWRQRWPVGGWRLFGGKKWSRRALLMETGSVVPGREGNLGVFLGATDCSAVLMFWRDVLARESAQ